MTALALATSPMSTPPAATPAVIEDRRARLEARFGAVRARALALAAPFSAEDLCVQSMPDASPGKWNLGHTTWFWETFVLGPWGADLHTPDPAFGYLFNSYYEAVGPRQPRPARGLLTRPSLPEVLTYRARIDDAMSGVWERLPPDALDLVELGLAHEEQHQELFLTDLDHLFAQAAFPVAVLAPPAAGRAAPGPAAWAPFAGGVFRFGWEGPGFAFDNEGPAHEALLAPFALATRAVTNADWLAFMADGGYGAPTLWLADGWAAVQAHGWQAPGGWRRDEGGGWVHAGLAGLVPVDPAAPVSRVSFYEAEAFATWAGARLPTEREWEHAATGRDPARGDIAPVGRAPLPASLDPDAPPLADLFGGVWEWTRSAYEPYPGYRPAAGAVGEYNGKFMVGQYVLRGGSCATPPGHVRASYRNFFPPAARWQVSGLRLARDV